MTDGTPRIPYIQSSASLQSPPPYAFPEVTVNSFVFEISMERVQHFCDRYFNIGDDADRDYVYRPLPAWPYASLQFLQYPAMISTARPGVGMGSVPYSARGTISQTEVFIAMPVMRYGKGGTKPLTHSALEWAIPFIVVDNPVSSVCGREMLGMGKLLAKIDMGKGDTPDSLHATVSLPGWEPYDLHTKQSSLPILDVKTKPVLPTNVEGARSSIASLFESREASWMLGNVASLGNFVETASLGLVPTTMRTVGLKQYRCAVEPLRAVYQALVTCRANYSNVRQFHLYNEKDVNIEFQDIGNFHYMLRSLFDVGATASGTSFPVNAIAGSRFVADINFDHMRVIRKFPIDRPGMPPQPGAKDLIAPWFRPLHGFFGPRR